jgi:hypothetical protein
VDYTKLLEEVKKKQEEATRRGNVAKMQQMIAQSPDAAGQKVEAKTPEPKKIEYIYDWESIFANPAQEKLFTRPFARGGFVDEMDDVNQELWNILKG